MASSVLLRSMACLGILLLAACSVSKPPEAPSGVAASTNASELVALPDFSRLVERTSPAVVSIEARRPAARQRAQNNVPSDADQQRLQELFRRFFGQPMPGMPDSDGPQGPTASFGSGFIVAEDGYVLTNHHVIDGMTEIQVILADRRKMPARLIGFDAATDIAVLKINAAELPRLNIGDSSTLKPGQWVIAIGSPFGFDHSVTAGIVSALGRPSVDGSQRFVPFIQTDVAINRGNSGGPLLNTRGEVVGVNSQIFSNSGGYMGVSFAIPIQTAMNTYQQIKNTGRVQRGQLGVQVREVQAEDLPATGMKVAQGAFVERVAAGSAAAKAAIRPGDIITAFNGEAVQNSSDLPPLVGALKPGSKAAVGLVRQGKVLTVQTVLDALPSTPVAERR